MPIFWEKTDVFFIWATEKIIKHYEGGFKIVDDPDDSGGITYAGITWRDFENDKFFKDSISYEDFAAGKMPEELIFTYYYYQYFTEVGAENMPMDISFSIYNAAINIGSRNAVKCMQRAVNTILYKQKLLVDGYWGPKSNEIFNDKMIGEFRNLQIFYNFHRYWQHRYNAILRANKTQFKYARGWTNRIFDSLIELK